MIHLDDNTRSCIIDYDPFETIPWQRAKYTIRHPNLTISRSLFEYHIDCASKGTITHEMFNKISTIYDEQKKKRFEIQKKVALQHSEQKQTRFNIKQYLFNILDDLLVGYLTKKKHDNYQNTFI